MRLVCDYGKRKKTEHAPSFSLIWFAGRLVSHVHAAVHLNDLSADVG